jgi:serine/threonine-protein kinase RsbW
VDTHVSVSVPADADYLTVVRTTVASTLAVHGLTLDEIEDLRLVCSEACGLLLAAASPGACLTCAVSVDNDGVDMVVSTDVPGVVPIDRDGLSWTVLTALVDDVSLDGSLLRLRAARELVAAPPPS